MANILDEQPNWPVKKGQRKIIEIEFTEDLDLYQKGGILRSLYATKNPFEEHGFRVTMIASQGHKEFVESLKKQLSEAINNINL